MTVSEVCSRKKCCSRRIFSVSTAKKCMSVYERTTQRDTRRHGRTEQLQRQLSVTACCRFGWRNLEKQISFPEGRSVPFTSRQDFHRSEQEFPALQGCKRNQGEIWQEKCVCVCVCLDTSAQNTRVTFTEVTDEVRFQINPACKENPLLEHKKTLKGQKVCLRMEPVLFVCGFFWFWLIAKRL